MKTPITTICSALVIMLTSSFSFAAASPEDVRSASVIVELIDAAQPGALVDVPAGTYEGKLTVQKGVRLDGRGMVVIDGGGEGTVVEITSMDVTFRGFTVRGSGARVTGEPAAIRVMAGNVVIEDNHIEDALFGIDLRSAPDCVIRRNTVRGKDLEAGRRGDGIRLWWSHNCIVEDNDIQGSRDMVFWYSEQLIIARNRVRDSRYGLHFMYSHNTVLLENELVGNSVGVYLMYSNSIRLIGNTMINNRGASGYGIGLKDCDDITLKNNALLANRVGLYIDNSPSSVDSVGRIADNMVAFNEVGMLATPITHDNVFTANAFVENEQQAATHGRGDLSLNTFYEEGTGNFWSDYAGYDLDEDGVGDLAYEPQSLFASMLAKEPNLRLFVYSPAQQAVELTSRAFPELRPAPTLVDPVPLSRAPVIKTTSNSTMTSGWPMAILGLGLVAISGVSCWRLSRIGSLPARIPGNGKRGAA